MEQHLAAPVRAPALREVPLKAQARRIIGMLGEEITIAITDGVERGQLQARQAGKLAAEGREGFRFQQVRERRQSYGIGIDQVEAEA